MILSLDALLRHLKPLERPNDAQASDALWIRFSTDKTHETREFRTKDENQILHVYLDKEGALVGLEIFP